ncbi:MAG: sugar phosphate nucleotidyltransferase, partial [Nanoarchaeota archaeon]|nr:sugar phosphate nucleotidyltransferase [Nanoarchaeota archaeon]
KTIFFIARHSVISRVFDLIGDGSLYGMKISYVEEKSSNGTADSLRLLKGRIKNNFLAVYGDILFNKINIEELWNDHIKQNAVATIMLTTSSKPSEKGTVKVEGNKVLVFEQKPKKSDIYLVFSPIFVSEPQIFEYNGKSLEFDVFPKLAEKGLLNGHLSSEKEMHVHSKRDLENLH